MHTHTHRIIIIVCSDVMDDHLKHSLTHGTLVACQLSSTSDTIEAESVETGIHKRLVLVVLQTDRTSVFRSTRPGCWFGLHLFKIFLVFLFGGHYFVLIVQVGVAMHTVL